MPVFILIFCINIFEKVLIKLIWIFINSSFSALSDDPWLTFRSSFYFFLVAANEELIFRGYFQRIAVARFGNIKGILIVAFIFIIPHFIKAVIFSHQSLPGTIIKFFAIDFFAGLSAGIYLGYCAYRTGNIIAPIIVHTLLNLPSDIH